MHTALQLFSNKGFNSTSVKEIADISGIGKGSIYNYFTSKEELFIRVFEKSYDDMFIQGNKILNEETFSDEEKFLEIIKFQILYFINNKFIMIDTNYNGMSTEKFEPIKKLYGYKKRNWQKEILFNNYGKEIEIYLDDLLIIFRGILSQFLNIIVYDNIPITPSDLAEFIVLKINTIVQDIIYNNPKPLLYNKEWFNNHSNMEFINETSVNYIFNSLKGIINSSHINYTEKEELQDVTDMLKNELQSAVPRKFLLKSLINTLENQLEASFYFDKLKYLYDI